MEIRRVTGEMWRSVFTPIAEIAQQTTRVSESSPRAAFCCYRQSRYSQFANTLSSRTDCTVTNYHYTLRNHPEERSSQRFRGGSLKSHMTVLYRYEPVGYRWGREVWGFNPPPKFLSFNKVETDCKQTDRKMFNVPMPTS